jgi:AraC-like DNA-binding protein
MQLVVGDGRIALGGALTQICRHRHASAAVVVGLDAPLRLVAGHSHVTTVALLRPGFDHAVDVRGRIAVFLLPVHAMSCAELAPIRDLAEVSAWRELGEAVSRGELDDFAIVDRAVRRSLPSVVPLDDRLGRALDTVANALDENLSVEMVAEAAGLSPSRVMALARVQLGTSVRGYRRWLRTFEVARRYAGGASLTEAAFDAGFASSAHLATTSRASFGIRPSQVLSPMSRSSIHVVGQRS